MTSKKSDFLVCQECAMTGERGRFEEEEGPTCKRCTRVYCLEASWKEANERLETVTKTLDVVLERLNAMEGSRRQEEGRAAAVDGNSKTKSTNIEDPEKGVQEKKEQKQGKAATNKRKDRVLLVGDSLVRHVGRNLEQQCVGLSTVCKPGGRIEQMVSEVEKRGDKEEAVIVHVGTNNLRMNETEEIMKYEEMIQRLKEERLGEVVTLGILLRHDLSEALERKRVEVNRRRKRMCSDGRVMYCEVEFNPWRGRYLGRDGLHLNARGADMVERQVFMMMKTLNLVGRWLVK